VKNEYTPEAEGLEWISDAACVGMDPDDFFVEAGRVINEEVLEVCQICPVRAECLRYSYDRNFTSGYFGGLSPGQRRAMTLKQAERFIRRKHS
jgi:WhiB family transcriptional regulator, redox-sensing transcriptional regulator